MDAFCGKASGWSKAVFVLLFPTLGLQCAGLGTIAWMKTETASLATLLEIGLWKLCNCSGSYDTTCVESALPSSFETNLLTLTRSLELASMVFIVFSLVLSAFYVTSPGARTQKNAVKILIFCFVAMLCNVGGMVAWLQNLQDNHFVYWSLGLTLIAASICLLCGVLMIPDIRQYDYDGVERKAAEKRERKRKKREGKDTAALI